MTTQKKVIAYIVRRSNKETEILVFDHHDLPEAGTQVIGGTVDEGENIFDSMIREIFEESGLRLEEKIIRFLGESVYQRKDNHEFNHRHYFLFDGNGLLESFSHFVESKGQDNGLRFDFYWLSLDKARIKLTGQFYELFDRIELN